MNFLTPFFTVVDMALSLYVWAIILSVILTWLVHFGVVNTRNQFVHMVGEFLYKITEPALRQIRRFIPAFGGIDISPIILILGIFLVRGLLSEAHYSLRFGA